MRHLKLLVVFLLGIALLSSCVNWDDQEPTKYRYNMVTVSQGGANPIFMLDDSIYLVPNSALPADTFVVGERYFIYYLLGDTMNHPINNYPIALSQYAKANIQNFRVYDANHNDVWFNQPIHDIGASWFTGRNWNLIFSSYLGLTSPNTYELVRNTFLEPRVPNDTVPVLHFELRHNVGSYSRSLIRDQFVCFDLEPLIQEFPHAKRFKLFLSWNSYVYGGVTYFENIYTPNTPSIDF